MEEEGKNDNDCDGGLAQVNENAVQLEEVGTVDKVILLVNALCLHKLGLVGASL